MIAVLAAAPKHQSAGFVFRTFIDGTGMNGNEGWGTRASHAYVCVIGMLMAQYTMTGERYTCPSVALMNKPRNQDTMQVLTYSFFLALDVMQF